MANELATNYLINVNVYAVRFDLDNNPFLTDGSSSETWNLVDTYDVTCSETVANKSMHYVGDFDASENIEAGVYKIVFFERENGSPLNSDIAIAQGIIYWDGVAEVDPWTMAQVLGTLEENTSSGDTSGGGIPTGALQPEESVFNTYDFRE